jgi:hypothetical protein
MNYAISEKLRSGQQMRFQTVKMVPVSYSCWVPTSIWNCADRMMEVPQLLDERTGYSDLEGQTI